MEYRLGTFDCRRCDFSLVPQDPVEEEQEAERAQQRKLPGKRMVDRYSGSSTLGTTSTQQYTERMMEHQYGVERGYGDPIEMEKKLLFWITTGLTGAYFLYLLITKLWGSFNLGHDLLRMTPFAIGLAAIIVVMYIMLFGHAIWLKWLVFFLGAAFLALAVVGGLFMGSKLPQTFWAGSSYFDDAAYTRMSIVFWMVLLTACGCQFWYLSVIWRDIQFHREFNRGERQ